MKLQFIPGKFYKTRDGRKAKFLGDFTDDFESGVLLFKFGHTDARWMLAGGRGHSSKECGIDIISEWKEPVKVSGWVNVYQHFPCSHIYATREKAEELADKNDRVACIFVSGTEGEEPKE